MKRPFMFAICLLFVLIFMIPSTFAAFPNGTVNIDIYNPSQQKYESCPLPIVALFFDNASLSSDVPAVTWNGRTMVPVRLISETLKATVTWVEETNRVIIQKGNSTIVLPLGSATASVNGTDVALPDGIPATVMRLNGTDRTMVPLRFVSEYLGCGVQWDQDRYSVSLLSPGYSLGNITSLRTGTNGQTLLVSAGSLPKYILQEQDGNAVLDFPGMKLSKNLSVNITPAGEFISDIRYTEYDNRLYPAYPSSVRIVMDLKEGVCVRDNITVTSADQSVIVSIHPSPAQEAALFTPTSPLNPGTKTVVIDPGHGGSSVGARYQGIWEKHINLSVSLKLEKILKDLGYNVIMTRSDDSYVGLYRRAEIANTAGCDLFVSLHSNAAPGAPGAPGVSGIYTFYYLTSRRGAQLASSIQSSVTAVTGAKSGGTMKEDFVVIRETDMCAVLVEMGFMSNTEEMLMLINDSYQQKLALGISEGIVRYLNKN